MYSSLGKAVLIAAFPVITMIAVETAYPAEFKSPLWGGSGGDKSYNPDCGSTGVMVGITGRTGQWIDQ